ADTVHNFSDALTAVPLLVAFRLGRRRPSRSHTYGYRRAEDLAGLFVVVMIAASAVLAGWESMARLRDPQPMRNVGVVFAAGVIGFLGNEVVALYRIRVGRSIGSAALEADGAHARVDGLTSLAVLGGAIGVALGWPAADPVIGLVIAVSIVAIGVVAARDVFARLLDATDPELSDKARHALELVPGVTDIHDVRLRWVGHTLAVSARVLTDTAGLARVPLLGRAARMAALPHVGVVTVEATT
ncbi:MAG: cation diffusion facilitator family transporter, partial [Arachnia sp.]